MDYFLIWIVHYFVLFVVFGLIVCNNVVEVFDVDGEKMDFKSLEMATLNLHVDSAASELLWSTLHLRFGGCQYGDSARVAPSLKKKTVTSSEMP